MGSLLILGHTKIRGLNRSLLSLTTPSFDLRYGGSFLLTDPQTARVTFPVNIQYELNQLYVVIKTVQTRESTRVRSSPLPQVSLDPRGHPDLVHGSHGRVDTPTSTYDERLPPWWLLTRYFCVSERRYLVRSSRVWVLVPGT